MAAIAAAVRQGVRTWCQPARTGEPTGCGRRQVAVEVGPAVSDPVVAEASVELDHGAEGWVVDVPVGHRARLSDHPLPDTCGEPVPALDIEEVPALEGGEGALGDVVETGSGSRRRDSRGRSARAPSRRTAVVRRDWQEPASAATAPSSVAAREATVSTACSILRAGRGQVGLTLGLEVAQSNGAHAGRVVHPTVAGDGHLDRRVLVLATVALQPGGAERRGAGERGRLVQQDRGPGPLPPGHRSGVVDIDAPEDPTELPVAQPALKVDVGAASGVDLRAGDDALLVGQFVGQLRELHARVLPASELCLTPVLIACGQNRRDGGGSPARAPENLRCRG